MEEARLAVPGDLAAISGISYRVAEEIAGARGGELFLAQELARGPLEPRVTAAIDNDDALVVVGSYDGVVLGWASVLIETLNDGRRLGVIETLAVDPEAREAGIGAAMMNLLLERLRVAGCFGVDSRALPGDRQTKNFFESFGLKARLLIVHQDFKDHLSADGDSTTPA